MSRLLGEVQGWPGVTLAPHRFGGTEFRLERGEIGHVHPDGLLDVPFPKPVRDELVASGRAEPHRVLPTSGWVSFRLRGDDDVPRAIELLRLAFDARQDAAARAASRHDAESVPTASGPAPADEAALDEAIEESFPASDPPGVSHIPRAHR